MTSGIVKETAVTDVADHIQQEQAAQPVASAVAEEARLGEDRHVEPSFALPVILDPKRSRLLEVELPVAGVEMPGPGDGASLIVKALEPLPPVRTIVLEREFQTHNLLESKPDQSELADVIPEAPAPVYLTVEAATLASEIAEKEYRDAIALPEPEWDGISPFVESVAEIDSEGGQGEGHESFAVTLLDKELFDPLPVEAASQEEIKIAFEIQHSWTLEVANTEPAEVYGNFTAALLSLTEIPKMTEKSNEALFAAQLEDMPGETVVAETPAVCVEVAEKLIALEPEQKEVALPIVKNIANAVQEFRLLETAQATPAELAVAEERLTELCVELFTAIGIEYDEEKVKSFVRNLLRPEFMRAPETTEELDLEHMGTHEVKRHFPQIVTDFVAQLPLPHALGVFALLRANPQMQEDVRMYEVAA